MPKISSINAVISTQYQQMTHIYTHTYTGPQLILALAESLR